MTTNPIQAPWPLKKPQQLIYVELGPHNGGMMLGICEDGLTLRAVAPLKTEGSVSFSFELDGSTRLQGTGEIAWVEDGGKTGGLKFIGVTPQFRDSLRNWLTGENTPKTIGREVTPAAALPLDSLDKIKSPARGTENPVSGAATSPISVPRTSRSEVSEAAVPSGPAPLPPPETPQAATFSLPNFRLPSAPPATPPVAEPEPPPSSMNVVTSAVLEKEYPLLPGLHQPYAHVPPESEDIEDSPQLNRAAAAAIIGIAFVVILVALVISFRREVGATLIHIGERLAGEPQTQKPTPASVAPTGPAQTTSSSTVANPVRSSAVLHAEDLPQPVDGGSGQKEFDQARNILKGNHRQRDIGQAINLLWIGVKKGYVPAEVTLADLYSRGDGVVQNCEQARVLLNTAIRKGSPEARRRLSLLPQQGCPAE